MLQGKVISAKLHGKLKRIHEANPVMFRKNSIIFRTNTLRFRTNHVISMNNRVLFRRRKKQSFIGQVQISLGQLQS